MNIINSITPCIPSWGTFDQNDRTSNALVGSIFLAFIVGGIFFSIGKHLSKKNERNPLGIRFTGTTEESPRIRNLRQKLLQKGFQLSNLPGKSHVYLNPNNQGLLIKDRGHSSWTPDERLETMEIARQLLFEKQFSHLVIPTAQKEEDYLVEQRLPIQGCSYQEQIDLYLNNLNSFTPTVIEFTRLLFYSNFTDLFQESGTKYLKFSQCPIPRWDNIPMYLEKSNDKAIGKIGLIDLEHFSIRNDRDIQLREALSICMSAIRLFPYHLDSILKVGIHFSPELKEQILLLEEEKTKVLAFFQRVYHSPVSHLRDCEISLNDPGQFIDLKPNNKTKIVKDLLNSSELSQLFSSHINVDKRENLFLEILELVQEFNKNSFKNNLNKKKKPSSMSELLKYREVVLYRYEIPFSERESCGVEPLQLQLMKKLKTTSLIEDVPAFVETVSEIIYQLLVKEKIIGGFQPQFYGKSDLIFF